jgi:hypothetical protein
MIYITPLGILAGLVIGWLTLRDAQEIKDLINRD